MPPVVLEPKHMSYQVLHPDPEEYAPPPEVQQEWNKVKDQVSLLMACNFPTHAKQLALFNETATIMASLFLYAGVYHYADTYLQRLLLFRQQVPLKRRNINARHLELILRFPMTSIYTTGSN
ncbi:hypothetical protein B0H14DRAFT_3458028 [Mycena olivaceomarginata]|nr:hypothetical protein B0H14DRAFT_3458028 [Mycena olivaceomarginata]